MPITIGSNIASITAQRSLAQASAQRGVAFERLSSGLRINHASDDAAGLSIASQLTSSSRVLAQGVRNVNDGISMLSVAEGSLQELSKISIRQKELAEQASNGVYSAKQRLALQNEANALTDEFNRIVQSTLFNGITLLSPNGSMRIQAGYESTGGITVGLGTELDRTVGTGSFTLAASYQANAGYPANGTELMTADFNKDGIADYAYGQNSEQAAILLGQSDGSIVKVANLVHDFTSTLAIGDFNGDGNLDIAGAAEISDRISLRFGNGDGTFTAVQSFATGTDITVYSSSASRIVAKDLNGDGRDDLTLIGADSNIFTYMANGNGTFTAGQSTAIGATVYSLSLDDFDGDGRADVAAAANGTIYVRKGNGDGTFGSSRSFASVGFQISQADFDLDGKIDLVTNNGTSVAILKGNGDGTFRAAVTYTTGLSLPPSGGVNVAIGDINNDGLADIGVTDRSSYMNLINRGDGTFTAKSSMALVGIGDNRSMKFADTNRDGILELIAADGMTANSLVVFSNTTEQATTVAKFDFSTTTLARAALNTLDSQLQRITSELGSIGSFESRLSVAANVLAVTRENYHAAASGITDADVAEESSALVRTKVLQQAGAAVLAQANLQPQIALLLLK